MNPKRVARVTKVKKARMKIPPAPAIPHRMTIHLPRHRAVAVPHRRRRRVTALRRRRHPRSHLKAVILPRRHRAMEAPPVAQGRPCRSNMPRKPNRMENQCHPSERRHR